MNNELKNCNEKDKISGDAQELMTPKSTRRRCNQKKCIEKAKLQMMARTNHGSNQARFWLQQLNPHATNCGYAVNGDQDQQQRCWRCSKSDWHLMTPDMENGLEAQSLKWGRSGQQTTSCLWRTQSQAAICPVRAVRSLASVLHMIDCAG